MSVIYRLQSMRRVHLVKQQTLQNMQYITSAITRKSILIRDDFLMASIAKLHMCNNWQILVILSGTISINPNQLKILESAV
jgi:hypothetical protein